MHTELLDIVDERDRVVASATRAEAHARGLRHRAVHIVVTNPAGEIYVQRRSLDKDCSPGLWDTSAAGHLDRGESYLAAARRELEEELGVRADGDLVSAGSMPASVRTGMEFVRIYRCVTDQPLRPDPHEIMDGRWVSGAALGRWLATDRDEFTTAFQDICQRLSLDTPAARVPARD